MPNFSTLTGSDFGVWSSGFLAFIAAGLVVWRKQSTAWTKVAGDKAERDWIDVQKQLLKEARFDTSESVRKERETWQLHERDAQDIASLKAENSQQMKYILGLEKQISGLKRIVWTIATPIQRQLLGSEFGQLDDPVTRPGDL